MKQFIGVLAVAGMVAVSSIGTAVAAQGGEGKAHKAGRAAVAKPELADMTATGVLSKEQKTNKAGKTMDAFVLTDAAGEKVTLGGRKALEGEAAKLADLVGKTVTVTGKGFKGAHGTRIVEITKVEVAAAAAVPVPAAPAAPAQ